MFALIKFIRNLFKQLKSDLTPRQLAIGVLLGALLGLTPFGIHSVFLFLLALLFNCSLAAFLVSGFLLKPVGALLAGAAFRLGASLLDGGGLYASIVRGVSGLPILAWGGYERYVVAGAYFIAAPVALLLALLVRFGVTRYRSTYAGRMEHAAWYQKAMKNAVSRFFVRFLVGREVEFKEKKRFFLFRPFRPYMAAAIPILCLALTVGGGLYAQAAIRDLAAGGASRALGVKVTFGKIDYSFFGQRLTFENFQLPDPSKPMENMVQIGGFEGDLGFVSLLSKRLHVETLAVRDVALRAARKEDGTLNVTDLPAAKPDPEAPAGEQSAWQEFLAWLQAKGKDVDWAEVWRKYQAYRAKRKESREKDPRGKRPPLAYDPDLRWAPERDTPAVRVDKLEVRNLALDVADRSGRGGGLPSVTHVDVAGLELSTRPGWNGRAMELAGAGKLSGGASGAIRFRFSVLPSKTEGEVTLEGLPLADYRSLYESTLPVRVEGGKIGAETRGGAAGGAIDATVNIRIDGLKIAAKPGETRILGLNPEMSGYAIMGINAYGEKLPVVAGAAVTGPMADPSIQAKLPFLEVAKKGLEMLGRQELQKHIDGLAKEVEGLKKLGTEKLVPLEGSFKKAQEAVLKGDLTGLQEAVKEGKLDAKAVPDLKKELDQKKDAIEGLKDLFKKKKDEKK